MWFSFLFLPAPSEPLLCKFADGGQKKRQNQSKYTQNGRPWPREGEVSPETYLEIGQPSCLGKMPKQTSGAVNKKKHLLRETGAMYAHVCIHFFSVA